ncbi:MAG: tetratricopeptide repeat protein [Candidatus Kurthia intestinigallinarum]|uniref:tetratricopeptide repeat protein n=1 Tax=Kurthia sp. Dielmo TaxID=1033738 RepID=UPI001124C581|nr:tetratricopeptide repeat protein [Kurthia sp. Dielmo]
MYGIALCIAAMIFICGMIIKINRNSVIPSEHIKQRKKLLKQAAKGDIDAQITVAHYYFTGQYGFEEDEQKAYEWYSKAAKQGSGDAMSKIGELYQYGFGVEKDNAKANLWFLKGADQGSAEAQFQYANALKQQGDYRQAYQYYYLAAEQQYPEAEDEMLRLKHTTALIDK